jgi:uroporphyrinogen-III synthase
MKQSVLVIREFDEFSWILIEKGFEVINLPLIETKALTHLSDFQTKLERIEIYDGIFLTSRHAARILAETLREKNINSDCEIYVLGNRSREILQKENLNTIFFESANTAREMLEQIPTESLKGKRFLFVRGEKTLRVVPQFLASLATVDEAIVYETGKITIGVEKLEEVGKQLKEKKIVCVCFFSPSAAESFLEQFPVEMLHQIKVAVIGKTTAEFFEVRNLKVDFVSPKSSTEDFAIGLTKYLEKEF